MDDPIEVALHADVTEAASAVQVAAVTEAGRQADVLLGAPPLPGTPEWRAEEGTEAAVRRQRAWELLQLRIGLGAGLDPLPTLVGLRRSGASWEQIAAAAGITRQSAHERWAAKVAAVLERG